MNNANAKSHTHLQFAQAHAKAKNCKRVCLFANAHGRPKKNTKLNNNKKKKLKDLVIFISAAFFEIFGCFAFWTYFRLNKPFYWLVPGILSLVVFAFLLTKVQTEFAGRAYAIYGGIYIVASLLWLYFIEHHTPDKWDIVGASICIVGAFIILFMSR